ncbi:hypothetical protein O181_123500 [Austropuccinia psidii MF-1]|uniref:Uncharacterized protein n=1 Tax=Austropuccinia psidii MF-1 TaxID=1389203 RepID=A0A9Q3KL90_9BASI|nr:hypothetical protein [Austropuccinia psidii MF-1]
MIKDMAMVQDLDGDYIILRLEILKLYIEQDLEAKFLIQLKKFSQTKSKETKARFEQESWKKVSKQMKDLIKKIQNPHPQENQSKDTGNESVKEVLNQLKHLSEVVKSPKKPQPSNNQDQRTIQSSQPFRTRYPSPPISSGYQPYFSAQMAPRQPFKCYYFSKERHSAFRCNHLTESLEKRIVLKHGGTYLFTNFQRVPTEGHKSAKELVRNFAKDQDNFTMKMMEQSNLPPKKQETTVIEQTRQRASRQENQNETQQEDKNETHKPFKKKIPGTYNEEDEAEEEMRVLIPTKKKKEQEGKEVENDDIEIISKDKTKEGLRQESQKMELKYKVKSTANTPNPIIEHVIKKILEQKTNLTLEEILSMSSTFIDKLQNLTTQEKEVIK